MTEPPLTTVEGVRANQRRSTRNSSLANNTDMDRLQAMLTFVTVVETEGFASAARKLAVSPSVISRVVTELEELLGVRLLTRTTRFMRLTEAGAAYFEDCRRILGEIEAAELSAAGERTTPRGQLTITAPVLFGKMFITPVVLDYLKHYPEVNVNCWFLDRIVNLVDEGADVAIRIGELPSSSLQAVRVGNVRRVMCAAPSYIEQHGMPKSPEALARHTTILASSVSPSPEWRFNDAGRQFAVQTLPRLITTTNDSAIVAAIAGLGITNLMSYQIAPEMEEGLLTIVLAEYEPSALPVHVVHREGKHVNQKVRAFLDLVIDKLRAEPSLRQ